MSLPVPLHACPGHLICAVLRSQWAAVTRGWRGCARPAGRLVAVSCCFQEPLGQRCCFPSPSTGYSYCFCHFAYMGLYISSFLLSVFLSFRDLISQSPLSSPHVLASPICLGPRAISFLKIRLWAWPERDSVGRGVNYSSFRLSCPYERGSKILGRKTK